MAATARRRPTAPPLPEGAAEMIHALHTNEPTVHKSGFHAILDVPLAQLQVSQVNPRRRFDPIRLQELADSIRTHGVLEPLIARPIDGDRFEIVAGERRYRAAQLAGVATVPVIDRALSDDEVLEFALIENLHRDALDPLEQARGFRALMTRNPQKYSPAAIAERLAMSERWVADRLSLLQLVPTAQQHLEHGRITVGHALRLARLKSSDQDQAIEVALFEPEGPTLDLETETQNRKPISVRELDAWIARHVRFDATHAATAAPLDFGGTVRDIDRAQAAALDVVAITHDSLIAADVRAEGAPIYTPDRWKRADGRNGSKVCEHSVLGVVAVGPEYGSTLTVCVHDACDAHWKRERQARQRETRDRAQQRDAKKARDVKASVTASREEQARQRDEQARQQWKATTPLLLEAVRTALRTAPIAKVIAILQRDVPRATKLPTTADGALRVLAGLQLHTAIERFDGRTVVPSLVKPLGVNTAALLSRGPTGGKRR